MSTRRSLNVAFLTSARIWRGSGVSFSNIAHGLIERGHRPYMFAGDAPVVEAFVQSGLAATRVPTAETSLYGAYKLVRELRAAKAHCLVVDRPRDLRLGALASLAHPVAIINRYNLRRLTPPRDLLSRLAYLRVSLTIFVSETSARSALRAARYLHWRPYSVIPEGVGPEFHPDSAASVAFRARYGLGNREFILAVGSLTADKRYDFLLEALKSLGSNVAPLVICGEGPLTEKVRQRAADLRLEVHFLGMVPPAILVGAYNAAVCLVHACEIESFGLCVLEAMACGCPVIAVDGGAVPEVIGQAGILAPPNDPAAFAARIQDLLDDSDQRLRLGEAAHRRATGHFSLRATQQAHADVIESVCAPDEFGSTIENAEPAAPRL